jgi:ABC-type multidrug transport system ATPase subunit
MLIRHAEENCAGYGIASCPGRIAPDEPFEGVDHESTGAGSTMLREATDRGAAVLITTHISPLVGRLSARVLTTGDDHLQFVRASERYDRCAGQMYVAQPLNPTAGS